MKIRSNAVVAYQLGARFEEVRRQLLAEPASERLDRPLAHWALPTDRRLPLAFMPYSLREILNTPFDDLYAAPGIGQKKIGTLIELLNRALQHSPSKTETASAVDAADAAEPNAGAPLDPNSVSEEIWEKWRETVVAHGLQQQTLGRFAPTLMNVPRVIWETPLENYVNLSLAEIRSLKTYGEKRVNCVIEVFGALHSMLAPLDVNDHLSLRVVPKIVGDLWAWIHDVTEHNPRAVTKEELQKAFVDPLLDQVKRDAGEQVASLAADRLKIDGSGASVRQTARKLGLTRARVYQLLADSSAVIAVRWPAASGIVRMLRAALERQGSPQDCLELLDATIALLFPDRSVERGAGQTAQDAGDSNGQAPKSTARDEAAAARRFSGRRESPANPARTGSVKTNRSGVADRPRALVGS